MKLSDQALRRAPRFSIGRLLCLQLFSGSNNLIRQRRDAEVSRFSVASMAMLLVPSSARNPTWKAKVYTRKRWSNRTMSRTWVARYQPLQQIPLLLNGNSFIPFNPSSRCSYWCAPQSQRLRHKNTLPRAILASSPAYNRHSSNVYAQYFHWRSW